MTQEIKIDAELEQIVYQDESTGLRNRRFLYTALRERVDWDAPRSPASLVLLGVDRPAGAKEHEVRALVRELAKRLPVAFDQETVLVRHGLDTFGLLLIKRTRDDALQFTEKLARTVAAEPVGGTTATFSIGVAGRPEDGSTPADLIDAAARALQAARRAGGGTSRVAPPAGTDPDLLVRMPSTTTVGREQILQRIGTLFGNLKHLVKPAFVLVHGPAGFGKSRVLNETLQTGWKQGVAAARADCEESSRHSPYRALSHLIERLGREMPDLELRAEDRLTPEQRMALRVMCPNFFSSGMYDAAADIPDPKSASEAVLELVRIMLRLRSGLVLAVNNAPLADSSSLEVFRDLLNAQIPLIFVASAASVRGVPEEGGDSPFPVFIEHFRRQRRLEELEIRSLTSGQVAELLQAIIPERTPIPALDTAIATHGKGSPLYVEEVIRASCLSGRPLDSTDPLTLPATTRHAVLASISALPAATREALQCGSVMGSHFDVDLLQEMLAWRDLELQQALDHALHARILRLADPRVPEILEFSTGYARSACYGSIDLLTRKRYHERIGRICEARLPEDAGWLVEAAEFHLERAASTSRGEALRTLRDKRQKASSAPLAARIQRIAPGTTPLGPDQLALLDALIRNLVAALRIGRLYPQGSQLSASFTKNVVDAFGVLLGRVTPLTIAVDGQLFKVNGVSIPIRSANHFEDLRGVFEERLVESVTVLRGIGPEEIDPLLAALAEHKPRSTLAADHWDKLLLTRGIRNADVVQKEYVAHSGSTSVRAVERPFDADGLKTLLEALRYFRATVEALKLYPEGHVLVSENAGDALRSFEAVFEGYPLVTLAAADKGLLVNGRPIDMRDLSETSDFALEQIVRRRLVSMSFSKGLTQGEILAVAGFLSVPFDNAEARLKGDRMLVEANVRHVQFGARLYARRESVKEGEVAAAAGETQILPPPPQGGRNPQRVSVSPKARADVRARVFLARPPTDLLTEAFERSFSPLLDALNFGSMCDLAVRLVQHLCSAVRDPMPENRAHALRILLRPLLETSIESQRMIVNTTTATLREVARSETAIPVIHALMQLLASWAVSAATLGALAPLVEVLKDGIASRRNNPATPPSISSILNELGRTISQKKFIPGLLEKIRKGNRDDRELSAGILASLGESATAPLVEAILAEKSLPARQTLAGALRLAGPAGSAALARHARADGPADRVTHVLEVLDLAGTSGLDEAIVQAILHPHAVVHSAAKELIRRIPRPNVAPMLRHVLKEVDSDAAASVIRLAGDLRVSDLATDVCQKLESSPPEPVVNACCHFLASVPLKQALPLLQKVVENRPKLFGMVKGFPDDIRAAAVWAIGHTPGEEARTLLARIAKEDSGAVRMAANQALAPKPEAGKDA